MLNSMTGFASKELGIVPLGKISIELKSSNHKFLEIVFHLPETLLFLEERIKKEIEAKIKRGRVTCVLNIIGGQAASCVFINKELLKNYILAIRNTKEQLGIKDEISMDTLIHLPGVLSLVEAKTSKGNIWPRLKILVNQTLDDLVKTRQKEGRALYFHLKAKAETLKVNLAIIRTRFKKAIEDKIAKINTDEERASFLKDMDITEEIERLAFHIRNFQNKILKIGPMGKELDFIAQEMQREANTMGAKSFDVGVSGRVVEIKSQIEKIREQLQNIE
jgi:uncharacterized protein (TIGR00255 family)